MSDVDVCIFVGKTLLYDKILVVQYYKNTYRKIHFLFGNGFQIKTKFETYFISLSSNSM